MVKLNYFEFWVNYSNETKFLDKKLINNMISILSTGLKLDFSFICFGKIINYVGTYVTIDWKIKICIEIYKILR